MSFNSLTKSNIFIFPCNLSLFNKTHYSTSHLNTLEHRITTIFKHWGGEGVGLFIVDYTCHRLLTFTVLHISTLNLLTILKTYMTGKIFAEFSRRK